MAGNSRQIAIYQTNKYLLEANDFLRAIEDGAYASNLHHKHSKIQLVALDYTDRAKKASAIVNVDPDKFLLLANDVLTNTFTTFSETKLLGHKKRKDGKVFTTILRIEYRSAGKNGETVKLPWVVHVENGWATPVQTETGGTYAQKGSYEQDKTEGGVPRSVNVYFSNEDFRRFVLVVANYIRTFEQSVFPYCMKLRSDYEKKAKK